MKKKVREGFFKNNIKSVERMHETGNLKSLWSNVTFYKEGTRLVEKEEEKNGTWLAQIRSKCFSNVHNNRSEAYLRQELETPCPY